MKEKEEKGKTEEEKEEEIKEKEIENGLELRTSPSWPLKTINSFIFRISKTLRILSREAERNKFPFWFHSNFEIVFL